MQSSDRSKILSGESHGTDIDAEGPENSYSTTRNESITGYADGSSSQDKKRTSFSP